MKAILASIFFAGSCLAFVGCESDVPPTPGSPNTLERGISGKGTLTEPDKSDDPTAKEATRVGY
jgi:hypothetical protein